MLNIHYQLLLIYYSCTHACMQVIAFNYGKGADNPIDQVWFYRKSEPTQAVKVHRHQVYSINVYSYRVLLKFLYHTSNDQISEMLPKTFEEFEMRLYVKKQVTDEMRERLFR